MQLAKEELGESTPGKYLEKESLCWNDAVQQAVSEKWRLFREWHKAREENAQKRYKEANKECKRVEAIAKENAYSQLYEELKGKEGRKKIYKLANARKRMATELGRVTSVKDKDGTWFSGDDEVKDRWLGYFDDLLYVENEREDLQGILPVQGPIEEIYLEEVITHLGMMKKNKACGPDCSHIEVAKALGDEGAIWMTGVLNEAMKEGIPEEWRISTITPIYTQKGDPLVCNNFPGNTLLSHTLKLWERVVENRLRKMVDISERQSGSNRESQRSNQCSAYGCYKKNTESSERNCIWCLWTWKRPTTGCQGSNLVLAQTKRCSRGLHKHNPRHVCWVQDKHHDQCGKDQRD